MTNRNGLEEDFLNEMLEEKKEDADIQLSLLNCAQQILMADTKQELHIGLNIGDGTLKLNLVCNHKLVEFLEQEKIEVLKSLQGEKNLFD